MEEENKNRIDSQTDSVLNDDEALSQGEAGDLSREAEPDGDITAQTSPSNGERRAAFITKCFATLKKIAFFIKTKIIDSEYFYLVGAFLLPVLLMAGAHAAVGFFPFGNSSILSLDFQAQYIYYYENVRKLITEGGSWLYT